MINIQNNNIEKNALGQTSNKVPLK